MQPSRQPKKGKGSEPDAAQRDRRLGKGARRDIKWALRQNPGDNVEELWVHGVKITYVAKKDAARDTRRGAQNTEKKPPPVEKPKKNSRQRRSERRARIYFAMKKASEDQTPESMTERAMATGQYPPPPSPAPRAAPPATSATAQSGAQASGQGASAEDDVSMIDAPGSGRGKGEKGTQVHPRSGRGRGGSQ